MIQVFETRNYDMFKKNKYQSGCRQTELAVRKIAEGYSKTNYIKTIEVTRDMTIIDGHNRLEFCKRNNLPITYQIIDVQDDAIITLNNSSTKWRSVDYLDYYAKDNMDYAIFKNIYQNSGMNIAVLQSLICLSTKGAGFAKGRMKLLNNAQDILRIYYDVRGFMEFSHEQRFAEGFKSLIAHPNYDHKLFMERLPKLRSKLFKCFSSEDYFIMLSNAYNYNLKKSNRIERD
jgi:hypothetical protein